MAINTNELGTTETDMSDWEPDQTEPAPTVLGDVAGQEPQISPEVNREVNRVIPTPAQRPTARPEPTQPNVAPSSAVTQPLSVRPPTPTPDLMPPRQTPPASKLPPRTEWLGTHSAAAPTNPNPPIQSPGPATQRFPTQAQPVSTQPLSTQPLSTQPRSSQPLSTQARPIPQTQVATPPAMNAPEIVTRQPSRKVSWIWPAVAAFILGGLLTAVGYRIGTQATEPAAPVVTTVSNTTVPPVVVAPPVIDSGAEPAAFVADKLGPSVVTVETNRGLGSGVIFDDGLILTNNHVIEGAGESIKIRLANGGLLDAELVGADPRVDIAVVSVGTGRGLPEAELALGEELEVGELAIAIGSPFQLQQTVTAGIISALNRPVQNGLGFTAMIQTDAPINPGNSGGALANREGRLIGINTAIQTAGDTSNAGVGFAVPIDTAYNVAQRIIAGEDLVGGFLGVGGAASTDGSSGVEVTNLTAGSGAELAGIRVGDRIISIDGAPVVNLEQLAGIVSTRFPGDDVEIGLVRNSRDLVIVATLGER